MSHDSIDADLKRMAEQWDVPEFDSAAIALLGHTRRRRRRRLTFAGAAIALAVAGVATAVSMGSTSSRNAPATGSSDFARPAFPPQVRVRALDGANHPITRPYVNVIARAPRGVHVTVRAQLSFPTRQRIRVLQAALLVAKPGTQPGVGGGTAADAYLHSSEIVRSAFISATSPKPRTLTVTTPANLPPGKYPVLYVVKAHRLGAHEPGGDYSTYDESGGVGAIVITAD